MLCNNKKQHVNCKELLNLCSYDKRQSTKEVMNQEIEVLKTIDRYVRGELTTEQIDDLWLQFLLQPEYYGWLEFELMIKIGEINQKEYMI